MKPDCSQCEYDQFCCTFRVKLAFWEFLRIRIRGLKDFWESDYDGNKVIKLNEGKCCFLNNSQCSIYSFRPKPCRDFPRDRCNELHPSWKKHQQKLRKIMTGTKRTRFQEKVYRLAKQIPIGKVSTYKELAEQLGREGRICRAVGQALNKSPGVPEVPCHRVICSDGSLGGFAWGTEQKAKLLMKEGVEVEKNKIKLDNYLFQFKTKIER